MTNYLFPNRLKKIGWLLFIPSLIGAVLYSIYEPEFEFLNLRPLAIFNDNIFVSSFFTRTENNLLDEILCIFLIVGGMFVAFSKEKIEDEMVAKFRMESLVWATYVNYIILLVCVIFVYGMPFLTVMMYNMFTLLFFFILRFYWMIYKSSKALDNEKYN
ncbi:hypothetical protein B0I10_103201 [Flavobacterium lacus]|uniref:Uncharacterized protein n=2 Tax=Flavobacterium lacus TaxID=1353778 RepID=A0A328WTS8_9FLAO|nr:hypothetical protein B0I10_103201 [Flavobacterium lacus]